MIGVIAKLPIKDGYVEQVISVFKELMVHVAKEEGCLYYTLNVEKKQPNTLIVMERYRDKEALQVHSQTPHFQEFFAKIGGLLDGNPEIITLKEIHSI